MSSLSSSSPLRQQPYSNNNSTPSLKRKTMSVTQTYYLAHTARGKLSHEAAQSDHNLRLLVGHANLLDSLMLELAEAEQEQESWFNKSVRGASKSQERRISWADQESAIDEAEEEENEWDAADSDSSDSEYDSDEEMDVESADFVSLHRVTTHVNEVDEEESEVEDDGEEDYAHLALTRTPSRSQSPPALDHDSDSSEDEAMPPSPPATTLPTFSEKQREQIATTSFYDSKPQTSLPVSDQTPLFDDGYYVPPRATRGLISAIRGY